MSGPRTLNGETQTLASNIGYAFGPLTGLTFGNGVPMSRHLDLDYRLAANIHQGVLEQGFSFDTADNISVIDDNLDMTASPAPRASTESTATATMRWATA